MFFAEGIKVVRELLESDFKLQHLYSEPGYFDDISTNKLTEVNAAELKKISALTTSQHCLALFEMPDEQPLPVGGLTVALDDVRDPGNLGTIIRLCDWFGISNLICSEECVDVYNPKVVQATMGSISRVNVLYTDLEQFLKDSNTPVFGTFMDGANIYNETLPSEGVIVLGNEANGISAEVEALCGQRLSIPRFGNLQQTESLNVATATAIILSEFKRAGA